MVANAEKIRNLLIEAKAAKDREDYETSLYYYTKAAEYGSGEAMNRVAEFYYAGLGVPEDEATAYSWYKKSAEAGFAEGMNDFALLCHWGKTPSGTLDNRLALEWFKKAGDAGFFDACNYVGWFYQNGIGTAQNYTEAVRWYEKAAQHNVALAINNLAWMYDHGTGVPRDHDKAMKYYRESAAGGDLSAIETLGTILFQAGKDNEAEKYFNEGIKQNSARSYNMLGAIYEVGYVDLNTAKQYYETAANLGDTNAMFNAARVCERQENFQRAFHWYEKAAQENMMEAIYSVGRFYNNGFGVNRNIPLAEQYYQKAANMGFQHAQEAYQRLQKEHTYTNYSSEYMWGWGNKFLSTPFVMIYN